MGKKLAKEKAKLQNQLLSHQVTAAAHKNKVEAEAYTRDNDVAGKEHHERRRNADTSLAEAKAHNARQQGRHNMYKAAQAGNDVLHHQKKQAQDLAAGEQKMHHADAADKRAQALHTARLAQIHAQIHHTLGHSEKRPSKAVTAFHVLTGQAGAAGTAMHHQVGGGH